MALFKIYEGSSNDLTQVPYKEGYCYLDSENGLIYIDFNNQRFVLNADQARFSLTSSEATHATSAEEAEHSLTADQATAAGHSLTSNALTNNNESASLEDIKTKNYKVIIQPSSWVLNENNEYKYEYINTSLKCGLNHNVSPLVYCLTNQQEYRYITDAEIVVNEKAIFTAKQQPTAEMQLMILDFA